MATKSKKAEVCKMCGKPISAEGTVKKGVGHLCERLIDRGYTPEKLVARKVELTSNSVPEGYIKVADLHRIIAANKAKYPGLSVNRMVTAIGRDRCLTGAVHPIAQPIYVGNTRWVHGWLKTAAGLKAIASLDFSKAPKVDPVETLTGKAVEKALEAA